MRHGQAVLFLPVLFGVLFCRFPRVMHGILVMPMSRMGMVRCFFMGSCLMVLRRFLMVVRCALVMLSGFLVMSTGFFGHGFLLGFLKYYPQLCQETA